MMRMTLGIDMGGSSSKATLIDETGKVLATSTKEYPSYSPHAGWLEQDADDLVEAVFYNIRMCLERSGVRPEQIAAVAVDAATHMAVLCDEENRPIRHFIHWSDARSSQESMQLRQMYGELLAQRCVNSVGAAWTLPQLIWLREHEPETFRGIKRIYFAKDYVRSKLTGDFCTDYIEAMGAMLANDHTMQWDAQLCSLAGIDPGILPPIKNPTDIAGYVTEQAAEQTGLKVGTPVIVGTTDTVLEVYASGAVEAGCATVKLATAGRICVITDSPIHNRQFFNYRHIVPGMWYPGTATRSCAACYKWYRDVFGKAEKIEAAETGTDAYKLLDREAEAIPPGSENLFFHPYLLGEMTPYYDDQLRASFTGIGMHHTKGHFSRALMEGISYSMRDCLEEIKKQNVTVNDYRLIGGGAKGKLWRQILADILGMPLTITKNNDSSLGSAMLAGVAVGVFSDFADSVAKCVEVVDVVYPNAENQAIYEKGFATYRKIQAAMAKVYHEMF